MNRLELIKLLSSSDKEEVFLEDPETGLLHDIEIKHIEEQFDGFDTAYPACLALKFKD